MRHLPVPQDPYSSQFLPITVLPVVISIPIALFILHLLFIEHRMATNPLSSKPSTPSKSQQQPAKTKAPNLKGKSRPKAKQSRHSPTSSVSSIKVLPQPRQQPPSPPPLPLALSFPPSTPFTRDMSYPSSPTSSVAETLVEDTKIPQPFDALLVLDCEATCSQGIGFDYPNEIIEFPVVLLRWADRDDDRRASELVKVAEFRSYVRPTWRKDLTLFCTALTGITQADVDPAPTWPQVLESFEGFLAEHGLIDPHTGARLEKFMFCSDGPFDVRDFVVKQCYISQMPVPEYFQRDVLDVRKAVTTLVACRQQMKPMPSTTTPAPRSSHPAKRQSLNIHLQLSALNLSSFEGRQHCGIDDARNIARIVIELARTPIRLEANTFIHPNRRWWWMTKDGTVDFPEYVAPYSGVEYGGTFSPMTITAPPSPTLSTR